MVCYDTFRQIYSGEIRILDTIHVSFMCHVLYYYLIINYGVPTSLGYSVWFVSLPASNVYPTL
ncbi:hypothetical protein F5141DRAFT_1129276, partial [Pisolithus sp. B1]